MRISESIEIDLPVRTVYDQWTQFEEFPRFMHGVEEVRQIDDRHLHWKAKVAGQEREWDAEITDQAPDHRVTWRSTDGVSNSGVVLFEPLGPDRTRVNLELDYAPEGAVEKIGETIGVPARQVENDLERFKDFIENRGAETGGWRGEIDSRS
jgi:uncharacterized membrane protein